MRATPTERSFGGSGCQLEDFPGLLERGAPSREEPWRWYLRRRARDLARKVRRIALGLVRTAPATPAASRPSPPTPPAQLDSGDRVRVRSAEEIRATLDERGSLHGCGFAPGMYGYCGRELRVVRRVERFFDEATFRMLRGRNLVLLEGVHCDGSAVADTRGCDRMCFYFWRTEWLERVE